MKLTRSSLTRQSKQGISKPRPDIRDDLDSRSRKEPSLAEERNRKGDRKEE